MTDEMLDMLSKVKRYRSQIATAESEITTLQEEKQILEEAFRKKVEEESNMELFFQTISNKAEIIYNMNFCNISAKVAEFIESVILAADINSIRNCFSEIQGQIKKAIHEIEQEINNKQAEIYRLLCKISNCQAQMD